MIKFLDKLKNQFGSLENLDIKMLEEKGEITKENTAIIIVDMVKGFYNEGPLQNKMVEEIIDPMVSLLNKLKDYKKLFFVDSHDENSVEFNSYPKHCVKETSESEIINELKEFLVYDNSEVVYKNSINGFHAKGFKKWLNENNEIENFIILGVCTDICVKNLAISLKTYFNEVNEDKKIIVVKSLVETFDADFHNREFMNLVSFYEMSSNGIEVVEEII
ncbi:MAG: isochorismatase family cysteine hydrolase [Sarcina sp.]